MTHHVLPGYITPDGHVMARPVIVTLDPEGRVTAHRLLDGHEPPFTTPLDALLHLPTLTLHPLTQRVRD